MIVKLLKFCMIQTLVLALLCSTFSSVPKQYLSLHQQHRVFIKHHMATEGIPPRKMGRFRSIAHSKMFFASAWIHVRFRHFATATTYSLPINPDKQGQHASGFYHSTLSGGLEFWEANKNAEVSSHLPCASKNPNHGGTYPIG